jgi:predicted PurR-regulated permease PerM
MSTKKILGLGIFIILIITAAYLLYSAWATKGFMHVGILGILGILLLVAAVMVILGTFLLEQCDNNFENMDKHITEMYKFSSSYLQDIPESEVVLPRRRNRYLNAFYPNLNNGRQPQTGQVNSNLNMNDGNRIDPNYTYLGGSEITVDK